MPKVGRFVTDPRAGAYCQITLDSGDKIVVHHEKDGFKGGLLTVEVTTGSLDALRVRCATLMSGAES